MKRLIIILAITVTGILSAASVSAQKEASIESRIISSFREFCKRNTREEIYLHTDREEYIAGEDIWFSTYLFDRQSLSITDHSTIVYVELLNSDNKPLMQKRILLDRGLGPGQLSIPDTLSSGSYLLRAYTSWMKNYLPANCFMKELTVYNALSPKGIPASISSLNLAGNQVALRGEKGIGIRTVRSADGILEVILSAERGFRESNPEIVLLIQTRGNINLVRTVSLNDEVTRHSVPASSLTSGINQITLFSLSGKPLAEKYIFTPSSGEAGMQLTANNTIGLREKEEITTAYGTGVTFSLSVSPAEIFNSFPSIDEYLLFGSEFGFNTLKLLKGRKPDDIPNAEMDSIMSGLSSNWIDWNRILNGAVSRLQFPVEKDEHLLTGRLIHSQQTSEANPLMFMCIPGKKSIFRYSSTDSEGRFSFGLHVDQAVNDLVIMPDRYTGNDRIILESSFSDRYPSYGTGSSALSKTVPGYIPKWSLNYQVGRIYRNSPKGKNIEPAALPPRRTRFYGVPDYEIRLADYIKLPVMEEVIFELLPQVSLKKKNGNYEITVSEYIDDSYHSSVPVLMIDGVVIRDASVIVGLDPENVEAIDVIKGKYVVGKFIFTGLINFITKAGNFSNILLPDYMTRSLYRVTDPVPSFVSPEYSSPEMRAARIPDYRNTLYWLPSLETGSDGKANLSFWSSDNRSDYIITVQGITTSGKPFSASKRITVK